MDVSIQSYIDDLNQADVNKKADAAQQLTYLAEQAQPAIIHLVQNCSNTDEEVTNWCTAALEGVGRPAASQIEELTALAQAANSDTAYWAITMLGRAKELAISAVPTLVDRLSDSSAPNVQCRAAWALGRLGSHATSVLESLHEATTSNNRGLVTQAKRALAYIEAN